MTVQEAPPPPSPPRHRSSGDLLYSIAANSQLLDTIMQLQSTPVKRPMVTKISEDSDDSFIRRPSDRSDKRRISAPIRDVPEERIAPEQVTDAPRAWRSRRLTLDSLAEVVSLILTSPPSVPESEKKKKKESGTPRRRSTQLVQKTPTAPLRRLSGASKEDPPSTLRRSKSFGSLAPLRPHRVETRKVLRDPKVVKVPLFD